jgi:quinol-cytochrome oxidoreductase complex cytochrome b subunit
MAGLVGQLWSGLLLALLYVPDPSFAVGRRLDYLLEVWWASVVHGLHTLGVDALFTLSYLHLLKKIYLRNYTDDNAEGWFTGVYAFLVFHLVVFLGITLSTNHLGDVTVTIAANMFWSIVGCWHRAYSLLFGNKHLSTDQLTRFMVAHYILAWYYALLVQAHILFVHEAWDADAARSAQQDAVTPKASWGWDAIKREVLVMLAAFLAFALSSALQAHPDNRVLNYSFFEQWSEAEVEDINFYIVAPHWYFRPHMGLLTVCARHYEGLGWLICFYALLTFLPQVHRLWLATARTPLNGDTPPVPALAPAEGWFAGFVAALVFVGGTLPCGRFYYEARDGLCGQSLLRLSYEYLYLYLGVLAHVSERLATWYASLQARQAALAAAQRPAPLGLKARGTLKLR